jgi:peptidoglycan/xylan/chitin deacetylase (PgdA/CDA1 family)
VALTFDDGPDPDSTRSVLAALEGAGVTATFFVLSERALRHRDVVLEVISAGHEIALHGPDHRRLTRLSLDEVRRCLRESKNAVEDLTGQRMRWFRPPFGSQSIGTYRAARRVGLEPVVWTAEGEDWIAQPADQIARRVMRSIRPGGVVLLHDALAADPTGPPAIDPLQDQRTQVANAVVRDLREGGLEPTSVGDLVSRGRVRRTAWFRP